MRNALKKCAFKYSSSLVDNLFIKYFIVMPKKSSEEKLKTTKRTKKISKSRAKKPNRFGKFTKKSIRETIRVLVTGDDDIGKKTLIVTLQRNEFPTEKESKEIDQKPFACRYKGQNYFMIMSNTEEGMEDVDVILVCFLRSN